ncbi:MAG: ChbG/HpnK family deacetylase [Chloroflexi bacterium]|nr:ChbG/HpnK family deacetylase [Chloroflexota bacterium]
MARLIVTCDDCGLSEGINHAALNLHRRGMAHHASVMTNFPAARHALDLFRAEPNFQIGAHLNLTEGRARTFLENFPLTFANGYFLPYARLVVRALAPTENFLRAVENELDAQIRVLTAATIQPAHLSTHMHFHLLPSLREIVFKLAREYRVPWVREYRVSRTALPFNPFLQTQIAESSNRQIPDYVAALYYQMNYSPRAQAEFCARLPGTVELAVHPSLARDETFPAFASYPPRERVREMECFNRFWQEWQKRD